MSIFKNSIIIPKRTKQNFIRKFCFQKRNPITKRVAFYLDINRILALSSGHTIDQCDLNTDSAFPLHFSTFNSFCKITFETPYGPLAHELFYQMVIRLNIQDLEYSWLDASCESWGTIEYEYQPTHTDNPFNVFKVYKNEMDQSKDQFCYVVKTLYSDSKQAQDFIATHIDSIMDDEDYEDVA